MEDKVVTPIDIFIERDVPCRTWIFRSNSPIAFHGAVHCSDSEEEKMKRAIYELYLPDSTLRWLYAWAKEHIK